MPLGPIGIDGRESVRAGWKDAQSDCEQRFTAESNVGTSESGKEVASRQGPDPGAAQLDSPFSLLKLALGLGIQRFRSDHRAKPTMLILERLPLG